MLRFGANGPEVIDRLKWMGKSPRPDVAGRLETLGELELKAVDGAGAAHGRRGAQPQRRGVVACS